MTADQIAQTIRSCLDDFKMAPTATEQILLLQFVIELYEQLNEHMKHEAFEQQLQALRGHLMGLRQE